MPAGKRLIEGILMASGLGDRAPYGDRLGFHAPFRSSRRRGMGKSNGAKSLRISWQVEIALRQVMHMGGEHDDRGIQVIPGVVRHFLRVWSGAQIALRGSPVLLAERNRGSICRRLVVRGEQMRPTFDLLERMLRSRRRYCSRRQGGCVWRDADRRLCGVAGVPGFPRSAGAPTYHGRNAAVLKPRRRFAMVTGHPGVRLAAHPRGRLSRLPADGESDLYPPPTPPEAKHNDKHALVSVAARLPRVLDSRTMLNTSLTVWHQQRLRTGMGSSERSG
jgi:hypothetical protein